MKSDTILDHIKSEVLTCMQWRHCQCVKGDDPSLLLSTPVRHAWSAGFSSGLLSTRETWTCWSRFSEGTQKQLRVWSICHTGGGQESLWLCSLENRRLRKDVINVYKYLMKRCKEHGDRLFSVVASEWTRDNCHKLNYRKFLLHIRKSFSFIVRLTEHRFLRGCRASIFGDIQNLTVALNNRL